MRKLFLRLGVVASAVALAAYGTGLLPPGLAGPSAVQAQATSPQVQGRGADLSAMLDTVERRTAELRGLPPREEVQRTTITPEQFRARLLDELSADDSQESIENSRKLMVALGLLAPDVDLYALELDFRTGVVLGQYDPESKQLYVISGATSFGPLERVTFAHEFTHALQDQHYNIRTLMPKDSDNSDRDLAVSSLLEGDALITEELYQTHALTRAEREEKRRQERNLGSGLNLDRLPLVIVEETYFPYTEGPKFVVQVVGQDVLRDAIQTGSGYGPRVNRILENPPKSSAQIIHPEKYLQGVNPIDVRFPDLASALGAGWKQLRKDVLGEIDHRILIQQFVNRELGDRAAAGWAGDAFALLGKGNQVAVVASTRWDAPAEAQEWFDAYSQAMRGRYSNGLQVVEQRPNRILWRTPDGLQLLSATGSSSLILIANTPDEIANLERALGQGDPSAVRSFAPSVTGWP
jgi:hypothetical protein